MSTSIKKLTEEMMEMKNSLNSMSEEISTVVNQQKPSWASWRRK